MLELKNNEINKLKDDISKKNIIINNNKEEDLMNYLKKKKIKIGREEK